MTIGRFSPRQAAVSRRYIVPARGCAFPSFRRAGERNAMYQTVKGLVLRTAEYREADKMMTILTAEGGKISASASGARRKGSRLAAASQPFTYAEFTLFSNHGRYSVNAAETLEQFFGLGQELEKLALASYFSELLEETSDEDVASPDMLRLGLNALYALSKQLYPDVLVKSAFELRLMALAGYAPQLAACAGCACGEGAVFDVKNGVLLCSACAALHPGGAHAPLTPGMLGAMRYILGADLKKLFSFHIGEEELSALAALTERYVSVQLDRGFKTLSIYHSL